MVPLARLVSLLVLLAIFLFLVGVSLNGNEKFQTFLECKYDIDENQPIPRVAYFTYHKLNKVPKYVYDNINKYCSGFQIEYYDDKRCEEFLLEYYGSKAVDIFRKIPTGPHKADFWRYCILYAKGGYYFDIKTHFQKHIDKIFTRTKPKSWYTVAARGSHIHNGIIVTAPKNPILWENIQRICEDIDKWVVQLKQNNHLLFVRLLFNIMKKYIKSSFTQIQDLEHHGWYCKMLKEDCVKGNDRYGFFCQIKDQNGVVFNTRYNDFPWK